MIKNLTSNQLLLLALAGLLLLIAAFSFYLLQDPSAPLPFAPAASKTFTLAPPSETPLATSTETPVPTRQTSYTPFSISLTPPAGTPSPVMPTSVPPPSSTPNPSSSAVAGATTPAPNRTVTSTYSGPTFTPTQTTTLSSGETGVTGRVLQNGTPMANITVSFEDDSAARQSTTNQGGHYWFTTLAPGTMFSLNFRQSDNPQLIPADEIAYRAWFMGPLPMNVNPIDLPDFEISLNLSNMMFEPKFPVDGAAYSASVITQGNLLPFEWSFYSLGGSYHLELGPHGSDQPIWTSGQLASSYFYWDGTLNDGSHITAGEYWWQVAVTKSLGSYVEVIFTQPLDLLFNP